MRALGEIGFAKPPTTQPEIQRQLQTIDQCLGVPESREELEPFLLRTQATGVDDLPRTQLNRVLRGAWYSPKFDDVGVQAVQRAEFDPRRSSDQAMIDGYLTYFPVERPAIGPLAAAAQRAADR